MKRHVTATDLFDLPQASLDWLAHDDQNPIVVAAISDEVRTLMTLLPGDDLREIAIAIMEGYTTSEIAQRRNCGLRTVERKLSFIRRWWRERSGLEES